MKNYLELLLMALEALTGIGAGLEITQNLNQETARSLVNLTCSLANQHQELIRRAVTLLEQVSEHNKEPQRTALLGNYLQKFILLYKERQSQTLELPLEKVSSLAFKLLIDLLFYSEDNGDHRLWSAVNLREL